MNFSMINELNLVFYDEKLQICVELIEYVSKIIFILHMRLFIVKDSNPLDLLYLIQYHYDTSSF